MPIAYFHAALAEDVPTAIHLLPLGRFKATDGREFDLTDARAVVDASMAPRRKLTIDENHATDYAAKAGFSARAVGRITDMEVRDTGIWGIPKWNDDGLALLAKQSYDGISAVIDHDGGRVRKILRAALTNDPAIAGLTRLFHNQETTMELAALRAALGLPDTADEAACLEAARSAVQSRTHLATFAAAAGVAATSTAEQIVAAIRATPTEMATLAARTVTLETELTTLRTATLQTEATAAIDAAIANNVPILPVRDYFIGQYIANPAGTKAMLAEMPRLNGAGVVTSPPDPANPNPIATLSAVDLAVANAMGTDPAKLVEFRKKRAEAAGDGRAA